MKFGSKRTAIIFIGLQACGKSTFYREKFSRTHVHISLDVLRTRKKEQLLLEECIANGRPFVVDNTNPTAKDRERYIIPAKEAGYRIVGMVFQCTLADCMARNELRTGKAKVPPVAIAATAKKLEPPGFAEGFGELYDVFADKGEFAIEKREETDDV